jgi:hypothetical protein
MSGRGYDALVRTPHRPGRAFGPPWTVLVALLVAILVSACATSSGGAASGTTGAAASPGSSGQLKPPFIPSLISSEAVVGRDRVLFGILDSTGAKTIAGPDLKVTVGFRETPLDTASPGTSPALAVIPPAPAEFIWAIPDERGVYHVDVDFPKAGDWTADFRTSGGDLPDKTVSVQFQVSDKGTTIPVDGAAPATKTPTLADVGGDVRKIATDPKPDLAFYQTSVDQALARHEPFVLVFATPAFCVSRQCGPTLDSIKAIAKDHPGVTFINAEPYQLAYANGSLQPILDANSQLQPTDAARAWGLLSEPWVFVVDRTGVVRGSYEAVVSKAELDAALNALK